MDKPKLLKWFLGLLFRHGDKPKFWVWFLGWLLASLLSIEYIDSIWKQSAKRYHKHDFFESNDKIMTPLSWTKEILFEGYKVTVDTYKQFVVTLATALFSGALLTGLVVREKESSIDFRVLEYFGLFILFMFIILYLRMKFAVANKDTMLTVVLEHDCTEQCRKKHFPSQTP